MSSQLGGRRLLVVLTVIALVLAGSAAVTGAFDTFQQPSGDEVLDRVEQRYESAETLTTTAVVTVENDTESKTATVEFAATDENQSRIVVSSDERTYRAGTNGTVVWFTSPNRSAAWPVDAIEQPEGMAMPGENDARSVVPDESDRLTPQGTPEMNASNVTATVVGTPTVDGTSTYEVELTHPETDATTTLWVAQDDARIVRAVATDGTNRTVVDVQSTAFNVSIHESTFDPPTDRITLSGTERYESFETVQSATDLTLPRLDATFTEATVTARQGETIVGQRYVLDGENVSIVSTTATGQFDGLPENATETEVNGRTVQVTTNDETAVVFWTDGDVTHAVVVEGSSERALEVAGML